MKTTSLLLSGAFVFATLLTPFAAANDALGTVCLPSGGPIAGCTEYGTGKQSFDRPDPSVRQWVLDCTLWVVCFQRPVVEHGSAHLIDAPVPYSSGSVDYPCLKGQTCTLTWDTRTISAVIAPLVQSDNEFPELLA